MKLFNPFKTTVILTCVVCITAVFVDNGKAQVFINKKDPAMSENGYKAFGVWPGRSPGSVKTAQLQSTDDYFFDYFPYPPLQEKQTVILKFPRGYVQEPLMTYGGMPLIMHANPNLAAGRNYANDYIDSTSNYKNKYEFDYNYSFDSESGIYNDWNTRPQAGSGGSGIKASAGGSGNNYDYSSGNTYIYNNYYYGADSGQPSPQAKSPPSGSGNQDGAQ